MNEVKIVFLILPHVHLLDLAGPDQVLLEAMQHGVNISVTYCGISKDTATSGALPFGKLRHFRETALGKDDIIIIPGTELRYLLSQELAAEKELMEWLKKSHENGVGLYSICTGAYLLAVAGLLDGRKCTTHWKHTTPLQQQFPKAQVVDNILFTGQDGIYTSAGVTAGIDMALYLVSKLSNDMISFKVARELVIYIRRQGHDIQQSIFLNYRNHIHGGIHELQDWLQHNLHKKSNLEDLAAIANMSPRNLTRVFKKETGVSVNAYITQLRKEKINELLKNPNITRHEIAAQCGLKSSRQVIRIHTKNT